MHMECVMKPRVKHRPPALPSQAHQDLPEDHPAVIRERRLRKVLERVYEAGEQHLDKDATVVQELINLMKHKDR